MNILSNKVSYSESLIDILITVICSGSRRDNITIPSHTMVTLGKQNISFLFCNTSYVDGGDKYTTNLQYLKKSIGIIYDRKERLNSSVGSLWKHVHLKFSIRESKYICLPVCYGLIKLLSCCDNAAL